MTVSRVVNNRPGVGEATRARVLCAMDKIGYRPNVVARALRTGQTKSIGIVCFATTFHGPASTLFAVEQAARVRGYSANVVSLTSITDVGVSGAVEELRKLAADAIIVISTHHASARILGHLPVDIPIVAIWAPPGVGVPIAVVDHSRAAAVATRHLLDLGHPTVWHVSGPEGWTGTQLRIDGWRRTLEEAGADVPAIYAGDWTPQSGYEAGQALLDNPLVTAVFLANDQMALGFAAAARERGVSIPGEVSIVGYDDEPSSAYFAPPLTTIHQDFEALGREAVRLAFSLINGPSARDEIETTVPTTLVVRRSTAPYRPRVGAGRGRTRRRSA